MNKHFTKKICVLLVNTWKDDRHLISIRKIQNANTMRYIETERGLIRQIAEKIEFIGEYS